MRRALAALRAVQAASSARPSSAAAATTSLRSCSSASAQSQVEPVAPAATYRDISDEWYLRQRTEISLGGRLPHIAISAWISPSAVVVGDVDLLDRASIWNNVVLRGDLNNITIGQVSNVQDRTVIHAARTSPSGLPAAVKIGKFVTIEPNCALRSCIINDFAKVGARSVLLEGSLMEAYSVLQPGSVLPPTRRVPEGELWGGVPARFIRKLSHDEKDGLKAEADDIRRLAWRQCAEELPVGTAWRSVEAWRADQVSKGNVTELNMRRMKYDVRVAAEQEASNMLSAGIKADAGIK